MNSLNLNCPYCGQKLDEIQTDVLSDWGGERLFICLNDECYYFVHSWETMRRQGASFAYRYFFSEATGQDGALLVANHETYRDRVIDWSVIEEPQKERSLTERLDSIESKLDTIIRIIGGTRG
jgi:hypothetical protein